MILYLQLINEGIIYDSEMFSYIFYILLNFIDESSITLFLIALPVDH